MNYDFMISKEEVKHIAKLARLGLTEKETEKMRKDLSSILDYVEKLKKADIKKANFSVETSTARAKTQNVLREDKINVERKVKSEKLLDLAPETKNGYLKVNPVRRGTISNFNEDPFLSSVRRPTPSNGVKSIF